MKRVLLFVATNLAIVAVLSIVVYALGLDSWLTAQGGSASGLLAFALVFGFGGAFISLALSKWMAKRTMGVRVIDRPSTPTEQWLLETVRSQAKAVGIGMPEVGIFESEQPNAFATGARRDHALVAISTALLTDMDHREIEAVLAHELSHIANGDMITLSLLQGVVNTFVIFLARIVGDLVDRTVFRSENGRGPAYFLTILVTELMLGVLASMIVMWFSRQREFRADAGGARLAGTASMIAALERLRRSTREPLPANMAAFGISAGIAPVGLRRLFMSHPPLEERIEALRSAAGSKISGMSPRGWPDVP